MNLSNRELLLDSRHLSKHLPDTPQAQRLLRRGRYVHVFNDEETMLRVVQAIMEKGEYLGVIQNYERYGLLFSESVGYSLDPSGARILLFYGEVKIDANDKYHPIPRTRPSEG
jgi:hypothetical protein